MNLYVLGLVVSASENILTQKLREGRKTEKRYSKWGFRGNFPHKIIQLSKEKLDPVNVISALSVYPYYYAEDDWMFPRYHFYARLYMAVSHNIVGYFKSYASDQRHRELGFHSEHWTPIPVHKTENLNHLQRWKYYLHDHP